MSASESLASSGLLGYLAVVEFAVHGIVGGYLLVNRHARPVEFHCTAPVCPSRTHEILYGPTLRSVVLNDQIGTSLLKQSKLTPQLLLTNEPELLELRPHCDSPIAVFSDDPAPESPSWSVSVGDRVLRTGEACEADWGAIEESIRTLAGDWDLAEPLDRIRAAIEEAHRAAA